MRTKYGEYPEYHTSLDKIGSVVTNKGLLGGLKLVKDVVNCIEMQTFPQSIKYCEPFLSKRNLYPTISKTGSVKRNTQNLLDFLSYCDGKKSILQINNKIKLSQPELKKILKILKYQKLIKINNYPI